ncbi:MAG: hypothetical protein OEZ13_07460 [Spirochaetia bacterium]|nr:hypothetical protein [Spirochaetia bacterium]
MVKKTTLLLMILTLSACKQSSEADKILNEMIEAYGGVENLKKYNQNRSTWSVNSPIKGKSEEIRYMFLPQKIRIQNGANDEIKIINNEIVYRGRVGEKPDKVDGILRESIKLQFARMYSPLQLIKYKTNISMITMGIEQHILQYTFGSSIIKYYINGKTGYIDKTESILKTSDKDMLFIAEYGDYKNINGVMVAHTERKYIDDMHTADNSLEHIEIDAKIDASLFENFLNL